MARLTTFKAISFKDSLPSFARTFLFIRYKRAFLNGIDSIPLSHHLFRRQSLTHLQGGER
ncbi:hypothetical protein LguiB_027954 [Lonicera macranthoides]